MKKGIYNKKEILIAMYIITGNNLIREKETYPKKNMA